MTAFLLIFGMLSFTALSAFFSATETSLFSLPSSRMQVYKQDADPRKKLLAKLLSKPRDLLVTILMMNIFVNIMVQNMASNLFKDAPGYFFQVGLPLLLTLIFGEIIPKSLAIANNVKISYRVAPAIALLQDFLGPLRKKITLITTYAYKSIFFFLKPEKSISKEELFHVLKTSETNGILNADEARLVKGYLQLSDSYVKELMQPREDVLFYKIGDDFAALEAIFYQERYTRVPVSYKGLDEIHGILHARHFFQIKEQLIDKLSDYLKPPFFAPENISAKALLRQMREKEEEMAIIVDEYGSVAGLVTDEDLIEVVIGNANDRQKLSYTRAGPNIIIASGKFELNEFEEIFSTSLDNPKCMVTIGGWLSEKLGQIPKSGSKFTHDGFLFQVLASDPNRVRRVYIRRVQEKAKEV